ncbi:HA-domain-containing protein [Fragilariopsis cylindrus CCMP1102]|uniref:HA-domain-containing protein n=1 Tax=Fragilariopsis cylindrus CCMP1102 TaxID=635003 RepID=A0A1E7ERY8_9STRA|nr:HA-domain-containing protein [Fragilariopsis cylindrus CCMP1102]|eukprot:OEU08619.1 HA-domain-containing protein [Fragilariopsis cylindrus CCMP1102]
MGYTEDQNERWNEKFQELVTYKKEHRSAKVPRGYARDPKLGNWVNNQRSHYNNSKLSETRVGRLDSVGFAWNPLGEKWTENFLRLVAYKKKHNSTNVPNRYAEDDHPLGNWVTSQRTFYRYKTLSIERIHRLESIGFVWNTLDAQWMECFHKLVSYKKKHKSTSVPRSYKEDPQLGQWVKRQRKNYRKKKLTEERTELLNSISFVWSVGRNFSDR